MHYKGEPVLLQSCNTGTSVAVRATIRSSLSRDAGLGRSDFLVGDAFWHAITQTSCRNQPAISRLWLAMPCDQSHEVIVEEQLAGDYVKMQASCESIDGTMHCVAFLQHLTASI